ncbi:MAG: AMP-binding protein [Gammaproteobacteria bacterium]
MSLPTSTLPAWFEPRLPQPAECSPGIALAQRAHADPDGTFAVFDDGSAWTNARALQLCSDTAGRLQSLGVGAGDVFASWLPTGPDALRMLFAASMLGAIHLPINVGLRGSALAHVLRDGAARILLAHPALVPHLDAIDPSWVGTLVVAGASPPPAGRPHVLAEQAIRPALIEPRDNQPWDVAAIIYSSGTTGPAKGVRTTFAQLWSLGRSFYGYMHARDRMLLVLPLFHVASIGAVFGTLAAGASFAVTEAFKASAFWDVVRGTASTTVCGLGNMMVDLVSKPAPQPHDRDTPLRMAIVTAVTPAVRAFSQRFACDVMACYSMTETSCISISEVNPPVAGTMGRIRKGIEARIVDENDLDLPPGAVGELILRADLPWVLNAGYHGNPTATSAAWRNGWFHTGDAVRADAHGNLFFVDRLKDVIRRRGENISANDIEAEARLYPAVQDAAAIPVREPGGDEEVMLAVAPLPGLSIDPRALVEFLVPRMAHFMVPRYVRVMDALPLTPTGKVQKPSLREAGLTPDCWDREAAGIVLKRERLG